IAIATTVQREMSCASATMIPSRTAIQSAMRMRRARNQRPIRVERCSIAPPCSSDWFAPIVSTVPSRNREPSAAVAPQLALGCSRGLAVQEEAVHGGAGAADVGAESAEPEQLVGERRGGKVVRRQRSEVARASGARNGLRERGSAVGKAVARVAQVERGVDRGRRLLPPSVREQEDDPVVLRELERLQLGSGSGAELRAGREEERHVRAEARRELVESLRWQRLRQRLVRQTKRDGGVGASAAEP